jgi:hypothetical protein
MKPYARRSSEFLINSLTSLFLLKNDVLAKSKLSKLSLNMQSIGAFIFHFAALWRDFAVYLPGTGIG